MNLARNRVLITGGAGFLGRELVRALIDDCGCRHIKVFSRDEHKHEEMADWADKIALPLDNVRFILGDVRDTNLLKYALRDVDYVIHAAAQKIIPAGQYNPIESVDINYGGWLSVVKGVLDNNKPIKVIGVSTDKACLDWHSRVMLEDGSTMPIGEIVKNKYKLRVLTIDDGKLSSSEICGWHKNKRANRRMYKISYQDGPCWGNYNNGPLVTEDHLILTTKGWIPVVDLKNNDAIVTSETKPNINQIPLIIGTLLGDSNLNKRGEGRASLRMGHAKDQLEWLKLKRNALEGVEFGNLNVYSSANRQPFYSVNSKCTAIWTSYYDYFYPDGKKIMPRDLITEYFSDLMLATWYLDDGVLAERGGKGRPSARIATHGFDVSDVEWLSDFLNNRGYECKVLMVTADGKEYPELRFTVDGSYEVFKSISRFVPPSMRRKIPHQYYLLDDFNPSSWDLGMADVFIGQAIVEEVEIKKRDVYCIDVEGTHNFISNGVVVHNCEPLNTYGKAKALGEDLFIHANVYSPEMRFSCVRYGNVIGSTSSLIAKLQGEASSPPLTHEDMTRFFMPVERSVDLIMFAMKSMFGGEIFVPDTKSVRIKDLFRYVSGKDNFQITGIRPGEKLDEVLINRYEAARSIHVDPHYWVILPEEFAHKGWPWTYPDPSEHRVELRSTDADVLMDFEDIGRFLGVERWTD